jgi:predicted enzyme related to lactoylglutathione lyase
MPNNVTHFAVHAEDVPRARRFYEQVFGWRFEAWGPPEFFLIHTGTEDQPGIRGALQKRREAVEGKGMIGYECTISVDDVDAITLAVEQHGGTVTMGRMEIPTVGHMIQFEDPEGNVVNAMCYDEPH